MEEIRYIIKTYRTVFLIFSIGIVLFILYNSLYGVFAFLLGIIWSDHIKYLRQRTFMEISQREMYKNSYDVLSRRDKLEYETLNNLFSSLFPRVKNFPVFFAYKYFHRHNFISTAGEIFFYV